MGTQKYSYFLLNVVFGHRRTFISVLDFVPRSLTKSQPPWQRVHSEPQKDIQTDTSTQQKAYWYIIAPIRPPQHSLPCRYPGIHSRDWENNDQYGSLKKFRKNIIDDRFQKVQKTLFGEKFTLNLEHNGRFLCILKAVCCYNIEALTYALTGETADNIIRTLSHATITIRWAIRCAVAPSIFNIFLKSGRYVKKTIAIYSVLF